MHVYKANKTFNLRKKIFGGHYFFCVHFLIKTSNSFTAFYTKNNTNLYIHVEVNILRGQLTQFYFFFFHVNSTLKCRILKVHYGTFLIKKTKVYDHLVAQWLHGCWMAPPLSPTMATTMLQYQSFQRLILQHHRGHCDGKPRCHITPMQSLGHQKVKYPPLSLFFSS